MTFHYQIQPAAENALLLTFTSTSKADAGLMDFLPVLQKFIPQVESTFAENLRELVPSYHSLLLVFKNPNLASATQQLNDLLIELQQNPTDPSLADFQGQTHTIPVCYDQSFGLDLLTLAEQKSLSIDEIIQLHSQQTYQVCAIGFAPAFAYLGEVDERLASPRHASPRLKIPAGSVGIADRQTAIYPKASPAGWQILGQTPWDLSLTNPDNLTRFRVGDQVKFEPISLEAFLAIQNGETL
ncbi:5-oxoprolinase subunit B family protein [Hydrogenovibrio kuenenii]|uniref:5-oxoprolinase subunit B family protein n=1 Tax=Hydrogenovibrio kuenenii TaxID=63658 RepID=UPI0004631337|nr:allophanate hydrolase subunit 1 [Hydrogenovibrio kuenenii]